MASDKELHMLFLPYLSPGHMMPMVNTARLCAARGVKATIITTTLNAAMFRQSVDLDAKAGHKISIHTLTFPAEKLDLPQGIESFDLVTSGEMAGKVSMGLNLLQKPMEESIRSLSPHCIVSDMFFPWTVDVAGDLKIPRILFYANSFFSKCVHQNIVDFRPHENVGSETESFVIPNLPDRVEMKRCQLREDLKAKTRFGEIMEEIMESERKTYGFIYDTFYELEPAYVDLHRNDGKRAWHVGPVFNFSRKMINHSSVVPSRDEHFVTLMSWLDAQAPNSVIYVCFGSLTTFSKEQLTGIALALVEANHPFVWVVRRKSENGEDTNWLPKDLEETMATKGMLIRTHAPQVTILNHPAIGGFMTHCGWNSILESITAGVPMITWPLFAEQFYNEKQVHVLGIGIGVGSEFWNPFFEIRSPIVGKDMIVSAINQLMGGSDMTQKIRQRAKALSGKSIRAVEEGGSSYTSLSAFLEEISAYAF